MKFCARALLLCASSWAPAFAQAPAGTTYSPQTSSPDSRYIKEKYRFVQVDNFGLKEGLEFPPEYVGKLQKEIAKYLAEAKLFQQVLDPGQQPPIPDAPLIRLTGSIHSYKQGSRAARYIGGALAGSSEIDAQVILQDSATGQKLVSKEVRGVLTGGVFGGAEDKTTQELAKQIASDTKLMLERRLPPAFAVDAQSSGAAPGENASGDVETQVLTIHSKDLEGAQKQLDDKAGAGYRVADYSLAGGYTANVQLEKTDGAAGNYQYRVLHTRLFNHLQGEIQKAAAEGFSVVPSTANVLGPYYTVIMEKAPGVSKAPYAYRVTTPMRMSSAQKDAEKFQADGYTLLDAIEAPGLYVLIFQKPASN